MSAATTRVLKNEDFRRAVGCLAGFLVLAVMTGPSGDISTPFSGLAGSIGNPRALWFVLWAFVLWSAMTLHRHHRARVKAWNDQFLAFPRAFVPNKGARYGAYGSLLVVAIVVPQFLSGFWQEVLVQQIGVFVLLAIGLNVVVGFAGLLDLGYVAFYAIGAYAAAFITGSLPKVLVHWNVFWAIPFGIFAAMIAGVVLGIPTLRLRGDYLAIVTLGFGEIVSIVAQNLTSITGGSQGVFGIPHFSINLVGIRYDWGLGNLPYWYLLLAFVVIVLVLFHALEASRVGRAWSAIREDEVAAEASGVHVLKYKVMAFAIGASTAGFAGVITASQIGFVEPQDFTYTLSILVLVLVIFGGMGSIPGAVLGAAVLQFLPQFFKEHQWFGYQQQDEFVYLGAILVIMMIFRPEGILPSRRRQREIGLTEHGVGSADAVTTSTAEVQ